MSSKNSESGLKDLRKRETKQKIEKVVLKTNDDSKKEWSIIEKTFE